MRATTIKLSALATGLALFACGREQGASPTSPAASGAESQDGWTDVVINVDNPETGLRLASADSYSAQITDCLSGYQKSLTQASASVQVQDGDFNCLFKLESLVYNSETFTMAGTENWAPSSSFNITGSSGTLMNFTVISNIETPVSGAQSVTVIFGAAEAGTSQSHAANISTGIDIEGIDPLGLSIVDFDVLVHGSSGAGRFTFKTECNVNVVGTGAAATCNDEVLQSMKVRLAVDTYTGALTLAQCRSLANTGGVTGTAYAAGSNATYPKGGLDTPEMVGPAALYTPANKDLILAFAGPNADSGCKYFRIAITPP